MATNDEIPEGWHVRKVSDFSEVISGSTPDTSNARYWNGNIIWITPEDLSENSKVYINNSKKKISNSGLKNSSATIIPRNSIVMSSRAPIGYLAVVTTEYTTNQGCKSLHLIDSSVPEFIYYSLLLNMNKIKQRGEGTTFAEISKKDFEKISILMPRLPSEQKKISAILQRVDHAIDKTKEILEKHKKIKLGLMQGLLEKGTTKQKQTNCIINKKSYLIPDCCTIKNLAQTSILKGRIGWQGLTTAEYRETGEYFLITGTDFTDGRINWDSCAYVSKKRYLQDENIQVRKEDLLITKDGTIGKIAYVDKLPKQATLNSGVFVMRPKNNSYLPSYMYFILSSTIFENFIENLKAGSTISHLYQKDFVNFEFPVPNTKEEQRKISEIFFKAKEKIESEQSYLSKLLKIKAGLAQDLLSGKVRVAA